MSSDRQTFSRRTALAAALELTAAAPLVRIGLPLGAALTSATAAAQVPETGTHVVLLGTQSGPNVNPERSETASALVVDGRPYLIDCGYGALMALQKSGVGFRDISVIFLTHLHDDHIADLAALLSHQWTDGRLDPTLVIGTYGTEALVDSAIEFTSANAAIRLVDEARSVLPKDIFTGRDIEAPSEPEQIFADDRIRVTTVENTHFPAETKANVPYRSVAYRFETADRSVVFSGDTAYSEALIGLARGADVFVCEAMETEAFKRSFDRRVAAGAYADNPTGVWNHITGTHSSTEDAGRMAAEAGVGMLVLNHLAPGGVGSIPDSAYIAGVRKHFDGEVVVGRDLLVI